MDVNDNKAAILKEIQLHANKEIAKLEEAHAEKLAVARKAAAEKLAEELASLKDSHEHLLTRLEKQKINSFELSQQQALLDAQRKVYDHVLETALADAKKDTALFKGFMDELKKDTSQKITQYRVPKGCGISGKDVQADLDDARVIGVLGKNEEVEVSAQDKIASNIKAIHDTIAKELF